MWKRRQSFGATASKYDSYRPGYPSEFIHQILDGGDVPRDGLVLDLGAGTGQLATRALGLGYRVLAVEPDDRMRQVLADNIGGERTLEGTAEEIPLKDATVDAVVAGQMWHWVDPSRAVPEVARVLKPGGPLAVLWSLRDDSVPWITRLAQTVVLPDPYSHFDDNAVPEFGSSFEPMSTSECRFVHELARLEFLAGLETVSTIALAADREDQLARAERFMAEDPDVGGFETIHVPYVCKAFSSRRRRSPQG